MNSAIVAATLCVASAGWTALAQEASTDNPPTQTPTQTTPTPDQPQIVSRCSQLIGTKVENQQGQGLGRISDVVVNFDNEKVSYCIISFRHGIFGKTRYVAVPLGAIQPGADGTHVILNATRDSLASTSGFDRNQLPSTMVPVWGAQPGQPEELPPVEVFAPPTPTVQLPAHPNWPDTPYPGEPISRVADSFAWEMQNGYAIK